MFERHTAGKLDGKVVVEHSEREPGRAQMVLDDILALPIFYIRAIAIHQDVVFPDIL